MQSCIKHELRGYIMHGRCTTDKLVTREECDQAFAEFRALLLEEVKAVRDSRYMQSKSFRRPQWSNKFRRTAKQNDARMVRKRYRFSH